MKNLIIIIVLGVAAYYGWNHFSNPTAPDQAITNPVYVEFRVKYPNDIELVGFGRMDSQEDCEQRAAEFWRNVLAAGDKVQVSSAKCGVQLSAKYQALFDNKVSTATYIAFDRGNSGERDGRFIIYGVPSSQVMSECPAIIEKFKRNFTGEVRCIQGSVG